MSFISITNNEGLKTENKVKWLLLPKTIEEWEKKKILKS